MNIPFQVILKGNDTLVWNNRVEAPTIGQAVEMALEFIGRRSIEQIIEVHAKEIK